MRSGRLQVLQRGRASQVVTLDHSPVTIGRAGDNDLALADSTVSRYHAQVVYLGDQWQLVDLGSANGTFIDGVRLAPQSPALLPGGASVRIGAVRLAVSFGADEPADARATAVLLDPDDDPASLLPPHEPANPDAITDPSPARPAEAAADAPPPRPMRWWLVATHLSGRRQEAELVEAPFTIGSDPGNSLVLADPGVAPFHAQIDRVDGVWQITDLGGQEGVAINGVRSAARFAQPLADGDSLQIGRVRLALAYAPEPPAPPVDEPEPALAPEPEPALAPAPPPAPAPPLPWWRRLLIAVGLARLAAPPPPPAAAAPPPPVDDELLTAALPADDAPPQEMGVIPEAAPPQEIAGAPDVPPPHSTGLIAISFTPDLLSVDPGAMVTTTVSAINRADVVDRIALRVSGIPEEWVTIVPATLALFPGDRGEALVSIQPPRHPSSRAGQHPFRIVGASSQRPGDEHAGEGRLMISPFHEFRLALTPGEQGAMRSAAYRLSVLNDGNQDQAFTLSGEGSDIDLRFRPQVPVVPPGASGLVAVTARTRRLRFIGRPQLLPFNLSAMPVGAAVPPQQIGGRLQQRPLPPWPMAIFAIALALLLCGFLLPYLRRQLDPPAPTAVAQGSAPAGGARRTATVAPTETETAAPTETETAAPSETATSEPSPSPEPTAAAAGGAAEGGGGPAIPVSTGDNSAPLEPAPTPDVAGTVQAILAGSAQALAAQGGTATSLAGTSTAQAGTAGALTAQAAQSLTEQAAQNLTRTAVAQNETAFAQTREAVSRAGTQTALALVTPIATPILGPSPGLASAPTATAGPDSPPTSTPTSTATPTNTATPTVTLTPTPPRSQITFDTLGGAAVAARTVIDGDEYAAQGAVFCFYSEFSDLQVVLQQQPADCNPPGFLDIGLFGENPVIELPGAFSTGSPTTHILAGDAADTILGVVNIQQPASDVEITIWHPSAFTVSYELRAYDAAQNLVGTYQINTLGVPAQYRLTVRSSEPPIRQLALTGRNGQGFLQPLYLASVSLLPAQ